MDEVMFASFDDVAARLGAHAESIGYIVLEDRTERPSVPLDRVDWTCEALDVPASDEATPSDLVAHAVAWVREVASMRVRAKRQFRRFRIRVMEPGGGRQLESVSFQGDLVAPTGERDELTLDLREPSSPLAQRELARTWEEQLLGVLSAQREQSAQFMSASFELQRQAHEWYAKDRELHRGMIAELLSEGQAARAALLEQNSRLVTSNQELTASMLNLHVDALERRKAELDDREQRAATQASSPEDLLVEHSLGLAREWMAAQAGANPALARPEVQSFLSNPKVQAFFSKVTPEQLQAAFAWMEQL